MSVHSSLRQRAGKTGALRNVLKRFERVQYLMSHGRWSEGQSAFGLPKIKQARMKARKTVKEKEASAEQAAETAETKPAAER